ncbi:ARM repeat-containing protein [Cylindrobasidium torrendii FP15055 ss-10]|uniref:ARM repeat-containing protein n=1 Tax=Cylindrobasidium torrendii FP15055 ss-10 TaxID=1314674 RepID=A0A0D7B7B8_9AGAR|nr:ARM repeat-containing protein [Cylindrobasidium torrendii FP15055 ss-10]
MRNRGGPTSDSEDLVKLKRNLKGLLNRMSEQNLAGILESVEDLYRRNSRNDVTSSLTSLIIEGIASHDLLLDSYVVLHAAFIAALYKIMGVDFAASFVQSIVENYETHYAALDRSDDDKKGKECSNLLVLLAELYNFQVISCVLVYDLIRTLLADDTLNETNVELLLKLIRSAGQQLRTDDPAALKDITQIVQDKVSASAEKPSSRTAFMIETLNNLKNGKVKKIGAQNQGGDAVESMKKFLGALAKKRHVLGHEALSVSLDDLHSADTKGKWWLVGAPWKGDPLVDRQQAMAGKDRDKEKEVSPTSALLKLAKKQGMNTDIRRSIFVVLMSSDDYIDACERLAQLSLTEIQQREVIRVLLHCCGNEKTYNPYYTLVAAHLCSITHAPKITLQFCLWDFLRDLGQSEAGGAEIIKSMQESGGSFDLKDISDTRMRNVAKAYAWWIAKDCVSLVVLKPIDFTALKAKTKVFLSELLDQVFVGTQVTTPLVRSTKDLMLNKNRTAIEQVFLRATRAETLSMGLVYFLTRVYETEDPFFEWAADIARDTLKTGVDVIPDL